MREIEIKARCTDRQALLAKFAEQNVSVSEPVTQEDQVFGLPGQKGDNDNQAPWLRIRTETRGSGEKTIFTLKKSVTGQLDSIEHETEVLDGNECRNIISHLGFVPYVRIIKTRQKAQLGDIEFCIDDVDGLGSFVEVERLTDESADYDSVVDELWHVFEQFSVAREDQVYDGYDVLMKKMEEQK